MTTITHDGNVDLAAHDDRFKMHWYQVGILQRGDWEVHVWDADLDHPRLFVHGFDNYGDGFRGSINWLGNLEAEPTGKSRG